MSAEMVRISRMVKEAKKEKEETKCLIVEKGRRESPVVCTLGYSP